MLALGSGLLLLARLGLVAAVGVSGSPPPSPCLPFDPFAADLQRGHWKFSKPKHWREENCTREFLVDRTPSFMSPPGCSERAPALRRFAADEVRGCLHNKHLLFIGDSVTRHQFESLIVLLETNSPAKGVSSNPTPHSALFRNSTNYNGCGERMRCETNRNANNHTALMENRYYFHPRHNITITMLGLYAYAFGHAPVGWRPASVPFSEEYEWSEAGIPTLAGVIRQWFGAVDVLQVNAGIWGLPAVMKRTWRSVSQYTAGPWQKARDELARLTPLVRQVCAILLYVASCRVYCGLAIVLSMCVSSWCTRVWITCSCGCFVWCSC